LNGDYGCAGPISERWVGVGIFEKRAIRCTWSSYDNQREKKKDKSCHLDEGEGPNCVLRPGGLNVHMFCILMPTESIGTTVKPTSRAVLSRVEYEGETRKLRRIPQRNVTCCCLYLVSQYSIPASWQELKTKIPKLLSNLQLQLLTTLQRESLDAHWHEAMLLRQVKPSLLRIPRPRLPLLEKSI